MKLKRFDDYLRTRLTEEEIMEIKEQAARELHKLETYFSPRVKNTVTHAYEAMYSLADAVANDKKVSFIFEGDATDAKRWLHIMTEGKLRPYWIIGVQIVPSYEITPLSFKNLFIVDDTYATMLDVDMPLLQVHYILNSLHVAASEGQEITEVCLQEDDSRRFIVVKKQPEDTWYICVYRWYEARNAKLKKGMEDCVENCHTKCSHYDEKD